MTPDVAIKENQAFDPREFLTTIAKGRTIATFHNKQIVFSQGDPCDSVFYIQKGKIRLTVVSKLGKEATIGILATGDFFGEGCLTGQPLRVMSAMAVEDTSLMRIESFAIKKILHQEQAFSDLFLRYLLSRNVRNQEDLIDQLLNSSEKRLARALLLLARCGNDDEAPETVIPPITQETLAEMVGTTRARVNLFMNKFRKLGFVDYDQKGLRVHSSLLDVVLHD